jgi:hypothetical protein
VVSATRTCGSAIGSLTSAPAAPAAKALSTNLWPSVTSPFIATNRSPGPISRESKATPVASKPPWTVPPVAAAISLRSRARS